MKKYIFFTSLFLANLLFGFNISAGEQSDTLSLIFIGDVMGHGQQIASAYNDSTKQYSYNSVFANIKDVISDADFTIANLEVTFGGKPYSGYPQFSSPNQLAKDCKNNGIDCFVTANNHSCDRYLNGIIKTINVLDSQNIPHTGTFLNSADRKKRNLMIINKKGISIGILNYTYGTNKIPVTPPAIVNMIDKATILKDLSIAKKGSLDKIIVYIHAGDEYKTEPSAFQKDLVSFLFKNGVDIVIGSHPHVIEKMQFISNTDTSINRKFVAYSLGNFVSAQRKTGTDGGTILKLQLVKNSNAVKIISAGYLLTWVYMKPINIDKNKYNFSILPVSKFEKKPEFFNNSDDFNALTKFAASARTILKDTKSGVKEYIFENNKWSLGK